MCLLVFDKGNMTNTNVGGLTLSPSDRGGGVEGFLAEILHKLKHTLNSPLLPLLLDLTKDFPAM